MIFEAFTEFRAQDFLFKIATTPAELRGYWALRRYVFCEEQHVFAQDDRDAIDDHAIPIICATLMAGMVDEIVGVVRIDQRAPRVWHGSRLAVCPQYRRVAKLSPSVQVRNQQPVYKGLGALGAGLIYKAVSTANALGCDRFFADVQEQNERFFQRLHWKALSEREMYGIRHVHMEADLDRYPPAQRVA